MVKKITINKKELAELKILKKGGVEKTYVPLGLLTFLIGLRTPD